MTLYSSSCAYDTQIFDSYGNGQRTFLASSEWLRTPWTIRAKSQYQRLIDLFARGTTLLTTWKQTNFSRKAAYSRSAPCILKGLLHLDRELHHFFTDLEISHNGPLYWEVSLSLEDGAAINSQPGVMPWTDLHFPDLELASIITLYWALLAIVWSKLTEMLPILPPHTSLSEAVERGSLLNGAKRL